MSHKYYTYSSISYRLTLAYITADNATVAAISPVVAQIKTQLTGAVTQLQSLVGQDSSVILAPVEGTASMTVASLATLIAGDLCVSVYAIQFFIVAEHPLLAPFHCSRCRAQGRGR